MQLFVDYCHDKLTKTDLFKSINMYTYYLLRIFN